MKSEDAGFEDELLTTGLDCFKKNEIYSDFLDSLRKSYRYEHTMPEPACGSFLLHLAFLHALNPRPGIP